MNKMKRLNSGTKNQMVLKESLILTHKKNATTSLTKTVNRIPIATSSKHKPLNSANELNKPLNNKKPKVNNLVLSNTIKPSNPKKTNQITKSVKESPVQVMQKKKTLVTKETQPTQTTKKQNKKMIIKTVIPYAKIKPVSSYSNTVSSTNNSDNNFNNNLFAESPKFHYLIDNTNLRSVPIIKSTFLQNNIFISKIYNYIDSILSKDYSLKNLGKNDELKRRFMKLEQKVSLYSLNTKGVNIINADMINNDNYIPNNSIAIESNNRREIYKLFFDFYYEICEQIRVLGKQLNNANSSLKRIDEVNSKISSLHSKINFSKTDSQCNNQNNLNSIIAKNNQNIQSLLISSMNSEFYQELLERSFKGIVKELSGNDDKEHVKDISIIDNLNLISEEPSIKKENLVTPNIDQPMHLLQQDKKDESESGSGEIIFNCDSSLITDRNEKSKLGDKVEQGKDGKNEIDNNGCIIV